MIKPIKRFEATWNEPKYYITIKKIHWLYEWYVDGILVFKDVDKEALLQDLNTWCKEQLLKIKQSEWEY
jgi:hypothetical protein